MFDRNVFAISYIYSILITTTFTIIVNIVTHFNLKKINLIFMRENGLYLGTDITRIPFKIIHNELGIKKCRFYDLRGYQNIK